MGFRSSLDLGGGDDSSAGGDFGVQCGVFEGAALGAGDAFDVQGVAMLWWWRSPTKVMYQWQQR